MDSSALFLLLCVTLSASGSWPALPLQDFQVHHKAPKTRLANHQAHKRQASPEVEAVCDRVRDRELCTNGRGEDVAYLRSRCNQRAEAGFIQGTCGINSMGVACISLDGGPQELEDMCGLSPITCTPECRNLLIGTRAQLGCCVTVFNDSISANSDENLFFQPFRNSLWSLCGVEPVTERCAPSFDLPTVVPTCDISELEQQVYSRVICRSEFINSLRDALGATCLEGPYSDYEEGVRMACRVNEQGCYCEAELDQTARLNAATQQCCDTSTCAPGCVETLTNITNTVGCCFIDAYNGTTGPRRDWLSYEFWQRCGLTSPGPCGVRFDDSPMRVSNAILTAPKRTVVFGMGALTMLALFV